MAEQEFTPGDFEAMGAQVIIEVDPPEEKVGSFVIPESARIPRYKGVIRSVGEKAKEAKGIAVGNRVVFVGIPLELSEMFGLDKHLVSVHVNEVVAQIVKRQAVVLDASK